MELFEIPETPLAFAVYNHYEIGVSTYAGNFAIFRDREHPQRLFAPRFWLTVAAPLYIRSAGEPSLVLIYVANIRESIEKYALVDLHAQRFVPLLIPGPIFRYTFVRLDADHLAMMPPGEQDVPPYRRSYLIETSALAWQPYRRRDDGFDDTTIAEPVQDLIWHSRSVSWQHVWGRVYQFALTEETPNDARIVSERVLEHINADDFLIPMQGVAYAVEADEQLRPLVEDERANLRREREAQA